MKASRTMPENSQPTRTRLIPSRPRIRPAGLVFLGLFGAQFLAMHQYLVKLVLGYGLAEPFIDEPSSFAVTNIADDIILGVEAATGILAAVVVRIAFFALAADYPR